MPTTRVRNLASFPPIFLRLAEGFYARSAQGTSEIVKLPFEKKGSAVHFRQQFYMFRQVLDIPHLRTAIEQLSLTIRESREDEQGEFTLELSPFGANALLWEQIEKQLPLSPTSSLPPAVPAAADSPLDTDEGFLAFMGGPETLPKTEQEQPK